ncbi:hypothetical protein YDYSY3_38810 [Paenibacillus chitinolyticus]|uniref:ThiF family adenylyltransferase n=1 Tax=Paenibacillus chitinolyticus TaxID=79263 RepID=UPI0026E4FF4D|nr:ThiF family adenylyltransferase [Paenibacillus chitinolyticus]GKS12881.1 hypothetical protein YDYSY3_38810 [Paenibacillus chitinolyticus]
MLNLIDIHNQPDKNGTKPSRTITSFYYYIVMLGAGGTGGYTVQRLTKMMSAFSQISSFLLIADPDTIEEKNLLRQPFIMPDIGQKKADVLAKRYGSTYSLKIGSYSDSYIESVEDLERLFSLTDYRHKSGQFIQKVLIGAVDNNYTRRIMNDYFQKSEDLIYIDAGLEGVYVPEGERPSHEWTAEEQMDHRESGYSGQVVVGVKKKGHIVLPALDSVYPILDHDAIPPSHGCGLEPYQPQRMIANEMSALQISTVVNELFANNSVVAHYVDFNARSGNCRPVYADDFQLEVIQDA